jgi:hypothetical protein
MSAHVLLAYKDSLLLVGGELTPAKNGKAIRTSDVWQFQDKVWHVLSCSRVHGEEVPTPRSNHTAAVWGDVLLVLGGWDASGLNPLARLELLHLETFCWTHGSTVGTAPCARGRALFIYYMCRLFLCYLIFLLLN